MSSRRPGPNPDRFPHCPSCAAGHEHPRCRAHNRSGHPCGRAPARGADVCTTHGGRAPQVKAAAARRLDMAAAARDLAALGEPVTIDPAAALLSLVHHKAGEVAWLRAMVSTTDLDDLVWGVTKETIGGDNAGTTHEAKPSIWWGMLRTAEDQLATYAAAAIKAGVAERMVRLEERKGELVAGVIQAILADLNLTAEQRRLVPTVVPAHIRALTEGA